MAVKKNVFIKILIYFLLFLWVIFTLAPLYWLLSSTFKPSAEAGGYPPTLFPQNPTLQNFRALFTLSRFNFYSYGHSLIISLGAMAFSLFSAVLAGYGLSRVPFPGRNKVMTLILLFQIFMLIFASMGEDIHP